jgi:hypothetical protein
MVPLEPLIGKKLIMELGVTSLISLVLIGILGDMVNSQIIVLQELIVMITIIIGVLENKN